MLEYMKEFTFNSKYLRTIFRLIFVFSISISFLFSADIGYCKDAVCPIMDFIYIDSSVDESAGGHAAVRFEQTVFHYQYHHNGLCLLVKESWPEFLYSYNNLHNRNLSMIKLPLSSKTYQKVKTQFLTSYLIQNRRLSSLEQLNGEIDFFNKIRSGKLSISIKGLGFFSSGHENNSTALLLRDFINNKLGVSYITGKQKEITANLDETIKNLQLNLPECNNLNAWTSVYSGSSVNEYLELCEFQEALRVIAEARPVAGSKLINTSSKIGQLTETELKRLQKYREKVKDSILTILSSSRPDKGSALLIQAARFYALTESLEHGHLITLDPFSENAQLLKVDSLLSSYIAVPDNSDNNKKALSRRNYFEQIQIEQLLDVKNAKKQFFSEQENEDIAFNQLEADLGRFSEINNVDDDTESVRVEEGVLLPGKIGEVTEILTSNKESLLHSIAVLKANEVILKEQLNELYGYNLVAKNCVTELFNTINSSFSSQQQAEAELGGYMETGGAVSYIPFCAFYLMKQRFPHASVKVFPSYRRRQKDRIYEEQGLWTLIKESNTLSSDIYYPWDEDTTFLFFTDDVVYTRPLYGVGNTVYAAANMVGGVVLAPIDEGSLLKRSMRGFVFSLPELAFFNIRKGTFPATAFDN